MKKKGNVIIASVLGLAVFTLAGFALDASADSNNGSRMMRGWESNKQGDVAWSKNLTTEQQALMETIHSEREQERIAHRTVMANAVNSGNYETWAATVREQMGENAPILTKVNADNFAQFAEGHRLMLQAHEKFESIGLDAPMMGKGKMKGFGLGQGRNHSLMNNTSTSVSQ